ncbi:c-type cytochrome [Celeribacter indicus]|uniref:Cytochrome c, class I n=1 Tax=Celeribacter indicus TaxID=1208324 RepID=A0A0B5E192_9RHOB|nr:c-type cytochrome [Celeribacter indicus]AJE49054.1 cytochrome c, class I [Celeribacter indicus]SDW44769.1 Cytochrome C oxidase, cbb3-type, subunit III [Celeribacter indicus]
MRHVVLTLVALAVLGLAFASAVVGFGLYNVSALAGHFPGVSWVLHSTYRNAVKLRAPATEVPDLTDPDMIALGAGHYATACVPCHAAPEVPRTATARAMVPEPPAITEAIEDWEPGELHWVVYNGIKMSGMPAWPAAGREDEAWPVVAYLEAVRRDAAPVLPEASPREDSTAYCRTCHGDVGGQVPRLDLLTQEEIGAALAAYRDGTRPSGIMQHAVSEVPEADLASLAETFAGRTRSGTETGQDPDPAASLPGEGEEQPLAMRGTRDVPACTACHGTGTAAGEDPGAPALAGQNRAYLEIQLRLWREGIRQGAPKMSAAAQALTDGDIAELADWFSRQPTPQGSAPDARQE